jgi:hypothetical protein
VFAAVQDADVPTEEVGQGRLILRREYLALWKEETFPETVQSELFWRES